MNGMLKFNRKILLLMSFFVVSCGGSDKENDKGVVAMDSSNLTSVEVTLTGPLNFYGTSLSTSYENYYSGFWRGFLCGDTGFAVIGVNGTSVELDFGAGFIHENIFGYFNADGTLDFQQREVSWDCESCGEVRPLETTGSIDIDSDSGTIDFEVACTRGVGHTISSIHVSLAKGASQPSPWNEMRRVESEINDLIGVDPFCENSEQCRSINLNSDDMCNIEAKVYSVLETDEDELFRLESEYHRFRRLSSPFDNVSSTTICGVYYAPFCEDNRCVLQDM